MEKVAIASDHAGTELKDDLKGFIKELGFEAIDMGTNGDESVDYPDYGAALAAKVSSGDIPKGVLICGTGIGMSIVANKFSNVRAALVTDVMTATMAKEHNYTNVLLIFS